MAPPGAKLFSEIRENRFHGPIDSGRRLFAGPVPAQDYVQTPRRLRQRFPAPRIESRRLEHGRSQINADKNVAHGVSLLF
jgi:hypothetical protein